MKLVCSFSGKQATAIGCTHSISGVSIEVPDNATEDDIRLACYRAGYDHIGRIHYRKVEEE